MILLKNSIKGFQKSLIKILFLDFTNSNIFKVREKVEFLLKLTYRGFWGEWSRSCNQIFEIQDCWANLGMTSLRKSKLWSNLVYGGFRSCWSRCSNHTFKIVNDGSNMAVKSSEKALVFIEIRVQGFSRSLIKSCHETFEIQSDDKS